jgi:hypothetical protein
MKTEDEPCGGIFKHAAVERDLISVELIERRYSGLLTR